jgi:YD repeat-containing protein
LKELASTISRYDYQYNAANKRTQITDANAAVTSYSYDNIYQLTREQKSTPAQPWSDLTADDLTADDWSNLSLDGWSNMPATNQAANYDHQYQYDAVQNRTVKNIDGAITTSTFDAANQLMFSDSADGRTTYTFDQNGNQVLEEEPNSDRTTTTYDYENQTSVIVLPTNIRNTMTYNPDQLRIKLEDSSGTTKFLWDGAAYLSELDETNATKATFTQEPGGYGGLTSQYRE